MVVTSLVLMGGSSSLAQRAAGRWTTIERNRFQEAVDTDVRPSREECVPAWSLSKEDGRKPHALVCRRKCQP